MHEPVHMRAWTREHYGSVRTIQTLIVHCILQEKIACNITIAIQTFHFVKHNTFLVSSLISTFLIRCKAYRNTFQNNNRQAGMQTDRPAETNSSSTGQHIATAPMTIPRFCSRPESMEIWDTALSHCRNDQQLCWDTSDTGSCWSHPPTNIDRWTDR